MPCSRAAVCASSRAPTAGRSRRPVDDHRAALQRRVRRHHLAVARIAQVRAELALETVSLRAVGHGPVWTIDSNALPSASSAMTSILSGSSMPGTMRAYGMAARERTETQAARRDRRRRRGRAASVHRMIKPVPSAKSAHARGASALAERVGGDRFVCRRRSRWPVRRRRCRGALRELERDLRRSFFGDVPRAGRARQRHASVALAVHRHLPAQQPRSPCGSSDRGADRCRRCRPASSDRPCRRAKCWGACRRGEGERGESGDEGVTGHGRPPEGRTSVPSTLARFAPAAKDPQVAGRHLVPAGAVASVSIAAPRSLYACPAEPPRRLV